MHAKVCPFVALVLYLSVKIAVIEAKIALRNQLQPPVDTFPGRLYSLQPQKMLPSEHIQPDRRISK